MFFINNLRKVNKIMKKIAYILVTFSALFINSHAYGAEARTSVTCFSQALQTVKNKDNFANLKSAKYNLKDKVYKITYLTKNGSLETVKISQITGKEVN